MKTEPYLIAAAPSTEAHPEFITADEAAVLLRLNPKTVRAYAAAGQIPGAQRIGGKIRIHRSTLVASFQTSPEGRARRRRG